MLSIYHMFEDNILILQETLVDRILSEIDKNLLKNEITDDNLFDFLISVESKLDVKIIIQLGPVNFVEGKFEKPNKIHIICPNNKNKLTNINLDIIYVLLHEISHFFTDKPMPEFFYIKNKPRYNQIVSPSVERIPWNEPDDDKIMKTLDYYYQLRELPNFAFSIAFGILKEEQLPEKMFEINRNIIKTSDLRNIDIYYWNLKDVSLQILFQLQYYTKKIKKSHYQTKLLDLKKLINKYYKRFRGYFPNGIFKDVFYKRF